MTRAVVLGRRITLGLFVATILACGGGGMSPGGDSNPTFIVYTDERDGNKEIYQYSRSYGTVENLTQNPSEDYNPTRGNAHTFFVSTRDAGIPHIFRMDLDGTNVIQLTAGPDADELPAVNFVESTLVFARTHLGVQTLYALNLAGGSPVQITTGGNDYDPAFTASDKLVFASDRGGNSDLWTCNADGSNLTQLTSTPDKEYVPNAFGGKIVFGYETSATTQQLDMMNLDGTGRALFMGASSNVFQDWPAFWRNDTTYRSYVVFSSFSVGGSHIWVRSIDGTRQWQIIPGGDSASDPYPFY